MILSTSKVCMRKDLGLNGNLFGGNMLSWMDEAAYLFARKITKESNLVTLRFGEITFNQAVKEGDVIEFFCKEVKKGTTSVTFDIVALVENNKVFSTDCTFVSLDTNGKKKKINWS